MTKVFRRLLPVVVFACAQIILAQEALPEDPGASPAMQAIADRAIQIIADHGRGLALIPPGTAVPFGLRIIGSSHPRHAPIAELRLNPDILNPESPRGPSGFHVSGVNKQRTLVFQYGEQSDFEPYRERFQNAIASIYARRLARAEKNGVRPDSDDPYGADIVVYLPHATQTGHIGLSSTRVGVEGETRTVRDMDYFLLWGYSDDHRFDSNGYYDCYGYTNCFIYIENDRHHSSSPVTTAYTCVAYGWEGIQGNYGYDEDNCISWVLYD